MMMINEALAVFLLAAAYDILLGEMPARIHPVVWIGRLISFLRLRFPASKIGGMALALVVIAVTVLSGHLLVRAAGYLPLLPLLLSAFLLKSTFSMRCLLQVSSDIGRAIEEDMDRARSMLPALVGRDTASLSQGQASSAVIESLSENYVDGILSPIFYYVLFSPLGLGLEAALAFKAVSTMDSMVGYKTEGLRELGFAGARSDDLLNFIPARLSIFSIALARPLQAGAALAAAIRFHGRTPSPNSGWPMAACAGALGLRLEKPGSYVLLDEGKEPQTSDVPLAIGLIQRAIFLILAAALLILYSA
ncbi:MAG TPA: cobalamin biosynthesis protein [Methanothrix sp.]|nr:cobalamin biosynthesis protein [Methanothrix sp.]HQQ36715.1 cobalamin biosynthesis protein [Methanothrix sp.]